MFDPLKCRQLSMEQKRELVYAALQWSDGAAEMLQAWSRQEILQVLCAELGKERKYTGLTKSRMIELLLKIVYENKSRGNGDGNVCEVQPSLENGERTPKRQRKSDQPNHPPVVANPFATSAPDVNPYNSIYCKNSACKAKMSSDDVFCKRCSCCICHQYDDNKDPSLWLICNSDPPFCGMSCSMSCHLECAFQHENTGISNDRKDKGHDGSFCCVSCGKVNDLLGSWRKQLVEARDTRRVDILCYRLSLGQRILDGTKRYQNLNRIVDEAVEKLEDDVGPLAGTPVKKARGIVNRLSSGPEIQRLCAFAVESLDLMLSNRAPCPPENFVRFEDIQASSVTVILDPPESNAGNVTGYTLWHRRADDEDYPSDPTSRLYAPKMKFLISGLAPAANYFLKVVTLVKDTERGFDEFHFRTGSSRHEMINLNSPSSEIERSQSPATNCSTLSNPSSVEDETNNSALAINVVNLLDDGIHCLDHSGKEATTGVAFVDEEERAAGKSNCISDSDTLTIVPVVEETTRDSGSNTPLCSGLECVPYVDCSKTSLAITPCKADSMRNGNRRNDRTRLAEKDDGVTFKSNEEPQPGSSSKKPSGGWQDKACTGTGDEDFEYSVKVIRWLECDGHIETTFRQKFLTWYSMRATSQEVRIVKVFIEAFVEDPSSLAGQLMDTFDEIISNKSCSTVRPGFCLKLWH